MKRNKGFTLIELLVVMAIIAILASIVVPNVQRYIVRAKLTRAVAEISGMDLSLTAIVTDAGRGNLGQMLLADNVRAATLWPDNVSDPTAFNPVLFENASLIYSQLAYDLLRLGRDCLRNEVANEAIADDLVNRDILSKIGTNYMDIALDPWGGTYRVWPGPWRYSRQNLDPSFPAVVRWPIPFRIFSVETGTSSFAVQKDPPFILDRTNPAAAGLITAVAQDAETWPTVVSYPADGNKSVFVWSYGENGRSSQMLYKGSYLPNDPFDWFYTDAGEDIAGGDDVNNWDSGNSWQRFYM